MTTRAGTKCFILLALLALLVAGCAPGEEPLPEEGPAQPEEVSPEEAESLQLPTSLPTTYIDYLDLSGEAGVEVYEEDLLAEGVNVVVLDDEEFTLDADLAYSAQGPLDDEQFILDPDQAFTISGPAYDLGEIQVGDTLVAMPTDLAPGGLLRSVVDVSQEDDWVFLETAQTTLEEVYEELDFEVERPFSHGDLDLASAAGLEGVTCPSGQTAAQWNLFTCEFKDVVLFDVDGVKVVANGEVTLDLTYDLKYQLGLFKVKYFSFTTTASEEARLEVSADLIDQEFEKEVEVWAAKSKPMVIPAKVPIIWQWYITLYVGGDGEVRAEVSTSVEQSASYSAGIEYQDGNWSWLSEFNTNFSYTPPTLEANLRLRGYSKAEFGLIFYTAVRVYADPLAFLELEAETPPPAWALYGGLQMNLGVKGKVLGKEIGPYEKQVIDWREKLAGSAE